MMFPRSWRRRMKIGVPICIVGLGIAFIGSGVFDWVGGAVAIVGMFVMPYAATPDDD